MAYTVLARRYRSSTFDELIGQEHIAQTLKRAIETGRLAHAYLFCGTRGTGKTSMARILAKCLNCSANDAPTTQPCGKCTSCQAVASGQDLDVIEIDAASNTGVDDVRDIISNAQFRPARSRFKIYIIDEVHMLSKNAFNALLKTLEEPPEHVKFILATTEPEKVLPTILSRCQRYDFRNIPTREIAGHLQEICKKESIAASEDAIFLVAKAGAGSMRDALSLLDRLLSIGEKELNVGMIEQLLGLPKSQLVFELAEAIGDGDVKATLERAEKMISGGLSADALLAALIDHLRNVMILRACGAESRLVEVPGLSPRDLQAQAQKFDPAALVQDIAILSEVRRQVRASQAGQALLDATLVRLAMADQFSSIGALAARVGALPGEGPSEKKKPELTSIGAVHTGLRDESAESTESDQVGESAEEPVMPEPSAEPAESADDALPAVGRVWDEGKKRSLSEIFKRTEPSRVEPARAEPAVASNIAAVGDGEYAGVWSRLLGRVRAEAPPMAGFLTGSELVSVDDAQVKVRFPNPSAPKYFEANGRREKLSALVSEVMGRPVGVSFEVAARSAEATPTEAPAEAAPAIRPNRAPPMTRAPETTAPARIEASNDIVVTAELREELSHDPLVKAVMERLGGTIIKVEKADV